MSFNLSNTFTIGQVSQRLQIPTHTLRFWEKELDGILVPIRTQGGQRRYTYEHVDTISEIKKLRDQGLSLPEIKLRMAKRNTHSNSSEIIDRVASEIAEIVRMALNSLLEKNEE